VSILFIAAFLFVGMFLVVTGTLFRLGRVRRLARYHKIEDLPFYARYMPYGMLPAGVGALAYGIGGFLFRYDVPNAAFVALGLGVAAMGGAVLAMAIRPSWLAPAWLQRRETRQLADAAGRSRSSAPGPWEQ
jgi:hypothetical protein